MNRSFAAMATMFMGVMLIGCSSEPSGPTPLVSQQAYTPTGDVRRQPMQDRPGALMDENAAGERSGQPSRADGCDGHAGTTGAGERGFRCGEEQRSAPSDVAAERAGLGTSAATLPSPGTMNRSASTSGAGPEGVGNGNYLILGSIIVEVNGTAISAGKVLDSISPVLAAKARDLMRRFRVAATKEIGDQLRKLIMDELEYAIAEHSLDSQDKRLAEAMTMYDRQEAIRKAGGSLQLARQEAAARGATISTMRS